MSDLRISDIVDKTGLSKRYWQRKAAANEIPGLREISFGKRSMYLVEAEGFDEWWDEQLKPVEGPKCPRTSKSAARSGTSTSKGTVSRLKDHAKQQFLASLKKGVTEKEPS